MEIEVFPVPVLLRETGIVRQSEIPSGMLQRNASTIELPLGAHFYSSCHACLIYCTLRWFRKSLTMVDAMLMCKDRAGSK